MAGSEAVERFGAVLKREREDLGLTLDELGERTGLDPSTIGKYERGDRRRVPAEDVVDLLEEALELDDERLRRAAGYATRSDRHSLSYGGAPLTPDQEQDVLDYIEFRRAQRRR